MKYLLIVGPAGPRGLPWGFMTPQGAQSPSDSLMLPSQPNKTEQQVQWHSKNRHTAERAWTHSLGLCLCLRSTISAEWRKLLMLCIQSTAGRSLEEKLARLGKSAAPLHLGEMSSSRAFFVYLCLIIPEELLQQTSTIRAQSVPRGWLLYFAILLAHLPPPRSGIESSGVPFKCHFGKIYEAYLLNYGHEMPNKGR